MANPTLQSVLHAIEKQNSSSQYTAPKQTIFSGSAPTKHKSAVNPKTSKGSTHDGGILGTIEHLGKNLGNDVVDTVRGIPGGVIQTIHHPIATAEAIGADYKKRYSPLVSGDFGKFFHQVGQHPLAPLLDLASVATGGGALAAKVGQSAHIAEAGRLADTAQSLGASKAATRAIQHPALTGLYKATKSRNRMISVEKGAEVKAIRVAQSGNPVKRLRQNLGLNVQESRLLPTNTPLVGLGSRARKAANNQRIIDAERVRYPQLKVKAAADNLEKAAKGNKTLHDAMATAANGIIDDVAPKDYARLVKDSRSQGDEIQRSIAKGLTQEEHHAETARLTQGASSKLANELYHGVRQRFQLEAIKSGQAINPIHLQHNFNSKWLHSPEVDAIVKLQKAHAHAATDAAEQLIRAGKITKDDASKQAVLHVNLARQAQGKAPFTPAEAAAHYAKAGLPTPTYNPDLLTFGDAFTGTGTKSEGALYKRGTRVNSPLNIVGRHELASKATDAFNIHQLMKSAAVHIPEGKSLPKNMVWVKDKLAETAAAKDATLKAQTADGVPFAEDYYTHLTSQRVPGARLAISQQTAKELALGRHIMTQARNEALAKGVSIWKYLVLTRPAFVVHNLLSNQLMYHLKNGWNFGAFHRMQAALKTGVFDEHHHAEGITFGESEKLGKGKNKVAQKASSALNVFYKVVGQHEHWLRQLSFYETARKMPEVRREMARLKGGKLNTSEQTMFHQAYNAAAQKSPHIRDLITRQMDDTLGNYRYYTHMEQNLKNLSPFYGWERHSVRNMVRMMEDNPTTMAVLTQLGLIGQAKYKKDFGAGMPEFVKNYVQDSYIKSLAQSIGLGKDVNMYDFNSTNPWTTAVDVGNAIADPKKYATSLAGPVVTAPIEELTGKSLLTGAPVSKTTIPDKGATAPFAMLERVIRGTPGPALADSLLGTAPPKKMLKTTKGLKVAQNVGLDLRNLDKAKAKKYAAQEAAPKNKYGSPLTHAKKKKAAFSWK